MANGNGGNAALKSQLASRAQAGVQGQKPEATIQDLLRRMGPEIAKALPKHLDADRLGRIALTTIKSNPKLLQCEAKSLLAAVMQCAQLGLEPNLLGHAYLVPYGNQVQMIVGYRGFIDLARRSGEIESISAHAVHENDAFEFEYGLHENLVHKPALANRGPAYAYYAVARFRGGGYHILVMSKEDVEKHRARSKAAGSGPWVSDYDAMALKTVIRTAAKFWPISVEILRQVESADESVKTEVAEDMAEVPNVITPEYTVADDTAQVSDAGAEVAATSEESAHV